MQISLLALSALALVGLALPGCGPTGPMPGQGVSGILTPPPVDWAGAPEVDTVQLETRPADPYSVNLWGVGLGNAFYVASSRGGSARWARYIEEDANVRLQVGDVVYELRAERVDDSPELDRFAEALQAKYEFEVSPEQRDQAWVFRLVPR